MRTAITTFVLTVLLLAFAAYATTYRFDMVNVAADDAPVTEATPFPSRLIFCMPDHTVDRVAALDCEDGDSAQLPAGTYSIIVTEGSPQWREGAAAVGNASAVPQGQTGFDYWFVAPHDEYDVSCHGSGLIWVQPCRMPNFVPTF